MKRGVYVAMENHQQDTGILGSSSTFGPFFLFSVNEIANFFYMSMDWVYFNNNQYVSDILN